jgi:hypothetical protein
VLDRKTIEVTDFSFRAENGLPAWFMAGKEIMPNARGHILPIYDKYFFIINFRPVNVYFSQKK